MEKINALQYILPLLAATFVFFLPPYLVFLPFTMLIFIFMALRFDGRIPLAFGGVAFVVAGVLLIADETTANQISILGYWLAVSGMIALLANLLLITKMKNWASDCSHFVRTIQPKSHER